MVWDGPMVLMVLLEVMIEVVVSTSSDSSGRVISSGSSSSSVGGGVGSDNSRLQTTGNRGGPLDRRRTVRYVF